MNRYRNAVPLILLLLAPVLLWGQRTDSRTVPPPPRDILTNRDAVIDPDPNIFDGTHHENFERRPQPSELTRVGETSYGKSLEGKENEVKGWVTGEEQNSGREESQRAGVSPGQGTDESPETAQGGLGGGEDNSIQVEQPERVNAEGGPEGEEEQGGGGGQSDRSGGMQQQQGGGGGGMQRNPLEMLKSISQAAQSRQGGPEGGPEIDPDGDPRGGFGNNPNQIEKLESPEVIGSIEQDTSESEQTNESSARSSASGRQQRSEQQRGGPQVGDDVPTGL